MPSASSAASIGGSTMSTPIGMSATPSARRISPISRAARPEQAGVRGDRAAQADHPGVDVLLAQPRAVEPVVLRGRAEVPDVRLAAARQQGVAGHLVARPLADVGARDVADVVEVEQQDARRRRTPPAPSRRASEPVGPQPIDVPALLPVDVHRAGRGEGSRHRGTPDAGSAAGTCVGGRRSFIHATHGPSRAQVRQASRRAVRVRLRGAPCHARTTPSHEMCNSDLTRVHWLCTLTGRPRPASSTVEENHMLARDHATNRPEGAWAGCSASALIVVACSGSAASSAPACRPASRHRPERGAPATRPPPRAPNAKTLEIAYLSFAVANSYDAPMLAAAQAAAAAGNAKLTVFDANLDPADQTKQLQDAVASGKYDAIITQPLYGAGIVEDVKKAIAAGIAVGNIDQVLGADMTTAELPGRGPERERRVRPERARQEDRRARRRGLRRSQGRRQPVQRRLHLVGQGRRARHRPQEGLRRGHRQPSRDQGRVRQRRVVLHDGRSA